MKNSYCLQLVLLLSLWLTAYGAEDYYEEYLCRKIFTPHGLRLSTCTSVDFSDLEIQGGIKARRHDYVRMFAYKSYIDRMRKEEDNLLAKYREEVEARWEAEEAARLHEGHFDPNEQRGALVEDFSDF